MVTHHPPIHLAGWSRRGRVRGHQASRNVAVRDHGDLLPAYSAWHALTWPTRHEALQDAVAGKPHPDPVVAAITHRWAIAQLGVPPQTWAMVIGAATILTGLIAVLIPLGLSLSSRIGLCAVASLTALTVGIIAVRLTHDKAGEIARASQPRR